MGEKRAEEIGQGGNPPPSGVSSCMGCTVQSGHVLESDLSGTFSWPARPVAMSCLELSPLNQGSTGARCWARFRFSLEIAGRKLMLEQGVKFSHGDRGILPGVLANDHTRRRRAPLPRLAGVSRWTPPDSWAKLLLQATGYPEYGGSTAV